MDWTNKNVDPKKMVSLGDEVQVQVIEIDESKRRISLGMKQCKANPWDDFEINFKKGDKVTGAIRSITDFGVFVGLAGGIDGLVHMSDLSWNDAPEAAIRNFKKGQEVEAVILSIDVDKERISLGIKQLEGDPFMNFVSINDKGSLVSGTVKSVEAKGVVVDLGEDIEGYLRASEISAERVEDAGTHFKDGDKVEAVIVSVDRKTRSISLSIKAKDQAVTSAAMEKMTEATGAAASGTTNLGALLKAKLEQN